MSFIFLDLDGTLLESRTRVHALFRYLVSDSTLTFEEYWGQKRNGIGHSDILRRYRWSPNQIREFERRWLYLIEQPEWLALDEPLPGVTEALTTLAARHALYLVTARQMAGPVLEQMSRHGWQPLFEDVLVTEGDPSDETRLTKQEIIRRAVSPLQFSDWMVGDTGTDIRAGQKLGLRTAAVLTGFFGRASLELHNPDLIVPDLQAFAAAILEGANPRDR